MKAHIIECLQSELDFKFLDELIMLATVLESPSHVVQLLVYTYSKSFKNCFSLLKSIKKYCIFKSANQ